MKRLGWIALCIMLIFALAGCALPFASNDDKGEKAPSETPVKVTPMVMSKGIPVLMYHKVGPEKDNDAVIREDLFAEQMKFLHDNGYHTLTMEQLYDYVTNGTPVPEKPVVLTFDDGYKDTYTIVFPLMKKYGLHATVFVNPGDIGQRLTWQELKEMKDGGMTIASHGFLHFEMAQMPREAMFNNFKNAQEALKRNLDIDNTWFCYPYGSYDEEVIKAAQKNGIKMASIMLPSGWVHQGDNPLALKRVWIGNAVDIKHFEERLTTEKYTDL